MRKPRREHEKIQVESFLPPPGLVARRFTVGSDDYVLIEFSPPAVDPPASLTPAEREVARRVAEGHAVSEIARDRKTSPHTVANQLRSIYEKLGISSRAELVRACRAHSPR